MTNRPMLAVACCALILAAPGCGRPAPLAPLRVRAHDVSADVGAALQAGRPVIVELEKGEIIPLRFVLEGDDLATPADAPLIPIVAKRHFFLRISRDGLAVSTDGVTFDAPTHAPGTFRIGVHFSKEGAMAEVEIHAPKR